MEKQKSSYSYDNDIIIKCYYPNICIIIIINEIKMFICKFYKKNNNN